MRRILPALFFVIILCVPFAWLWMLPEEFKSFAQSIKAVAIVASNFHFWRSSDYFDTSIELKPLIHTWSLSVEEQYYIMFPFFLFVTWKIRKESTGGFLCLIAVASFGLAQLCLVRYRAAVFYLLPTRAWELLIGALVGLYCPDPNSKNHKPLVSQLFSILGATLIGYSIFSYGKRTPFPGVNALAPTVGAALIIAFSTTETIIGRLLANRLLVGIGLLSYSLYLWHQPVFALARIQSATEPSSLYMCSLTIAIFPAAYLTWRYIERPFRDKNIFSRRHIFRLSLMGSAIILVTGIVLDSQLIQTRAELRTPKLFKKQITYSPLPYQDCGALFDSQRVYCKQLGSGSKTLVVWGDSHADVLSTTAPLIDGVKLYLISHLACPPLIGIRRIDSNWNAIYCNKVALTTSYAHVISSLNPDYVVLLGRWNMYLNGWHRLGKQQPDSRYLSDSDDESVTLDFSKRQSILKKQLEETINFFAQNSNVFFVLDVPDYADIGFRRIATSSFSSSLTEVENFHKGELEILSNIKPQTNLFLVDGKKSLCSDGLCQTRNTGNDLFYLDDNHLSPLGSVNLWKLLLSVIGIAPKAEIQFPKPSS